MQTQLVMTAGAVAVCALALFVLGIALAHRAATGARRQQILGTAALGAVVVALGSSCCMVALMLLPKA